MVALRPTNHISRPSRDNVLSCSRVDVLLLSVTLQCYSCCWGAPLLHGSQWIHLEGCAASTVLRVQMGPNGSKRAPSGQYFPGPGLGVCTRVHVSGPGELQPCPPLCPCQPMRRAWLPPKDVKIHNVPVGQRAPDSDSDATFTDTKNSLEDYGVHPHLFCHLWAPAPLISASTHHPPVAAQCHCSPYSLDHPQSSRLLHGLCGKCPTSPGHERLAEISGFPLWGVCGVSF